MSAYESVDMVAQRIAQITYSGNATERIRLAEVLIRANNTFPQREWQRAMDRVNKENGV